MENNDKPLGTPNLNEETPSSSANNSSQTPPPTQKRKLNWKGFGIGIIAVIVIEFLAVTMLQQGDPQISLLTPTPKPTAPVDQYVPILASITQQGGLCQTGKVCSTSINVYEDGVIKIDDKESKKITKEQVNEFKRLIATTDFTALKSKPFTGTCPTASDGQEILYLFYTDKGTKEDVPSCKYEIDTNQPLFKFTNENILK